MTPAEVEAVLALWREVEGTRPEFIHNREGEPWIATVPWPSQCLDGHGLDDLLCGHLRRWLEERCLRIELTTMSVDVCGPNLHRFEVSAITKSKGKGVAVFRDAPSLLLALIAAVRAVAGTSGQPQEKGGPA